MKGNLNDNLHKIHKMDDPKGITDMFYPKMLYQCSNIANFPQLFK